jgi:hypothetical protein
VAGMADVTNDQPFRIEVDWSPAQGVVTPELAATWCNLKIWVRGQCITTVEAVDSGIRRGIYTTALPLAEWIAYNWWPLVAELRPSAVPRSDWSWVNVRRNPWLRRHNAKAAGSGMTWPDLTIVNEGAVTRIAWTATKPPDDDPVRFLLEGVAAVRSDVVQRELRRFLTQVLDRLQEAGLTTDLEQEWNAIVTAGTEEAAFARSAARLGIDPYSISDRRADELISLSEHLDEDLLDEFLDSADPEDLGTAVAWIDAARSLVESVASAAPVSELRREIGALPTSGRPFARGYELARALRSSLDVPDTERFEVARWVSETRLAGPSAGLEGYVGVRDHVRLVLPEQEMSLPALRFALGRSLGLALAGERHEYLLDPARSDPMKQARAFAAELLAPAAGISTLLERAAAPTEAAFDAIAKRYEASSLLVRRQYDNQLVDHRDGRGEPGDEDDRILVVSPTG